MQNKQSLYKLIEYFRNFNFDSSYHKEHQNLCEFCQLKKINLIDHKGLDQMLYESVLNAKMLVSLFQERVNQLLMDNQRLEEEIQELKEEMKDEKSDWERMMEESKKIIQELRTELIDKEDLTREIIEKEENNKTLIDQLEHLENELDRTQHELRKYQTQETHRHLQLSKPQENPFQLQYYQQQIRTINQNLSLAKLSNSTLMDTVAQLQSQILSLTNHSQQTHQQPQNHYQIKSSPSHPSIHSQQTHLNCIQIFNSSNTFSQNQIQNQPQNDIHSDEYQELPIHSSSILKDILNSLQQHPREQSSNEHLEKDSSKLPKVHKSQKQNNYSDSNLHSIQISQKSSLLDQNKKSGTKQKSKFNENLTNETNITSFRIKQQGLQSQSSMNANKLEVKERNEEKSKSIKQDECMAMNKGLRPYNSNESKYLDPYYSFFMLSGQCIKINSQHFEEIAEVNVEEIWEETIEKRIPMNEWNSYLQSTIYVKAGLLPSPN